MAEPEQSGAEGIPVAVNGHSIDLDGFTFVCENEECELEEQAFTVIRHAAANLDCPVEKVGDDGLRADGGYPWNVRIDLGGVEDRDAVPDPDVLPGDAVLQHPLESRGPELASGALPPEHVRNRVVE